jgi:hypothetical protein
LVLSSYGQEIKYYHTYRTSDSELVLTKWRVDPNEKGKKYIVETTDKHGCVLELRFFDGDDLYEADCYNHPITKFIYEENKIIQLNFINDSTSTAGIECDAPAKIIYYLDKGKILNCKKFLNYDSYLNDDFKIKSEFREKLKQEKYKNKDGIETNCTHIWGFNFSSSKYKGYLPVSSQFDIGHIYVPYSEDAKKSVFSIYNSKNLHDE